VQRVGRLMTGAEPLNLEPMLQAFWPAERQKSHMTEQ
jgi:hypothetical protein